MPHRKLTAQGVMQMVPSAQCKDSGSAASGEAGRPESTAGCGNAALEPARPTVAVLDDEIDAARPITAILNQQGLRAFFFTSQTALTASFVSQTYKAFVLDWYLGNGTAGPLIGSLRSNPIYRHVPIFILSGNLAVGGVPTDKAIARLIEHLGVQYRAKPYSGLKLAADLRLALGDLQV